MGKPGWRLGLAAVMVAVTPLWSQQTVAAPGGVLTGVVEDSVTGQPVGYALVVADERDQRVFASASGRFTLSGLGPVRVTLRVTQIGYRGSSLALTLDTRPLERPPVPLTIFIQRQPFVLPEVLARSEECPAGAGPVTNGESGTILDEAFRNAERMLALQKAYPYRSTFQHMNAVLNPKREVQQRIVDTVEFRSQEMPGYERGKVLVMRRSTEFGRTGLREHANYFQASDLARPEFRRNHCFWVAGRDSVQGFPVYRIEFRPLPEVRTPDWAGILQIDSVSMLLLRSEAWLVNLPPTGSAFTAARCSALYTQLLPSLVLEFRVHCVAAQNVRPPAVTDDRWTLIQRAFMGRRPDQ